MAEHEIATALELMQGGLKFEHDADGWWWVLNGDASLWFNTELDAVRDFCRWYSSTRIVKDEPQPAPFSVYQNDIGGWCWSNAAVEYNGFSSEGDAKRDAENYVKRHTYIVSDEPQPAPFDLEDFMMDGIQALVRAAAEEMRARGEGFDAETVAGALARAWHIYSELRKNQTVKGD